MKIRYLLTAGCSAFALSFAGSAAAQVVDQSAEQVVVEDDAGVGEIIVTANKREQSINKVGLAITAVSGEALAQQRVVSLSDLAV